MSETAVLQRASDLSWNNEPDAALDMLRDKKDSSASYARQWALVHQIRDVVKGDSHLKEQLLELWKRTAELAEAEKGGPPPANDEGEEEAVAEALGEKKKKGSWFGNVASSLARTLMPGDAWPKDPAQLAWRVEVESILADATLMKAMLQLQGNHYVKGALNLRRSWGMYAELLKVVTKHQSNLPVATVDQVKGAVGVFYIFLSLVPPAMMTVLSAIGFKADAPKGEEFLQEVWQRGGLTSSSCALVLLTYYLIIPSSVAHREERIGRAADVIAVANGRYPNNTYFHGFGNFLHRAKGDANGAVRSIEKAIDGLKLSGAGEKATLLLRYIRADTYFMSFRWEEAGAQYAKLMEELESSGSAETFDYTGQVTLTLAATHRMRGDTDAALKTMGEVAAATNKKSKSDAFSPRFAHLCEKDAGHVHLAGPFCLYLNRDLPTLADGPRAELAAWLQQVAEAENLLDSKSVSVRAWCRYFMGALAADHDTARKHFLAVVQMESSLKEDTCAVVSSALYELYEIETVDGNASLAKNYLVHGLKAKGERCEALNYRYSATKH